MQLSQDQRRRYDRDGYLRLPSLLAADEVATLRDEVARLSRLEDERVFREGAGGPVKALFAAHETGGATASAAVRALALSPRVLGLARRLLDDEALYLHHSKINLKAALEGSVWPWHQDFGQWHLDGIAAPQMTTVMMMLDDATELGGCLYFLPGSHRRGRLEPHWDESTAYKLYALPPEQVRRALAEHGPPVAVTGKAGDAAVFHCNLVHASGHNLSAGDRWQAYFCFNRVANRPLDVAKPRPHFVRSREWAPLALGPDALPVTVSA